MQEKPTTDNPDIESKGQGWSLKDFYKLLTLLAILWVLITLWDSGDASTKLWLKISMLIVATYYISFNLSKILTKNKDKSYILTGLWLILLIIWMLRQ